MNPIAKFMIRLTGVIEPAYVAKRWDCPEKTTMIFKSMLVLCAVWIVGPGTASSQNIDLGGGNTFNPYTGVANQGPYIDAVYQQYETSNRNNQPIAALANSLIIGGGMAQVGPNDNRAEGEDPEGGGEGILPVPSGAGAEKKSLNTKSGRGAVRHGYVQSPGSYAASIINQQGIREGVGKEFSSGANLSLLEGAFTTKVVQHQVAMHLANAAVATGLRSAFATVDELNDKSFKQRQEMYLAMENNPSIRKHFTDCLEEKFNQSPTASWNEVNNICIGESHQAGMPLSNDPSAVRGGAWQYNKSASSSLGGAAGAITQAPTAALAINTKKFDYKGLQSIGPIACKNETVVGLELFTGRIYGPAIDWLKKESAKPTNLVNAGSFASAERNLEEAQKAFRAYYGDIAIINDADDKATSSKIRTESIKPFVCEAAGVKEMDSLAVLRRSIAVQAVHALLREGQTGSSYAGAKLEEDSPGLLVERCERHNTALGPFSDTNQASGNQAVRVAARDSYQFCNPRDNSQLYRRAALAMGDYSFTPEYCEAVWFFARSWLESKGSSGIKDRREDAVLYDCNKLTELGKSLSKQIAAGKLESDMEINGVLEDKPDFIKFIQNWALSVAFSKVEKDLPQKVADHIASILANTEDSERRTLLEHALKLIDHAHHENREMADKVLEGFQKYISQVLQVAKSAQTGVGSLLTYGSSGSSSQGAAGSNS